MATRSTPDHQHHEELKATYCEAEALTRSDIDVVADPQGGKDESGRFASSLTLTEQRQPGTRHESAPRRRPRQPGMSSAVSVGYSARICATSRSGEVVPVELESGLASTRASVAGLRVTRKHAIGKRLQSGWYSGRHGGRI